MNKQLYRFLALCLVVSVASCDYYDFDAIPPIDLVPGELAITNRQSAEAARAGVYDELQDATLVFDGYIASFQYFSDESDWTGTFPTRAQFDNYNVLPSNGTMGAVWNDYYDLINVANNLLTILPTVEDLTITDDIRNNLLAEARMGRAIGYFHLVQGWGEVPLILTPTIGVGDELNVAKSSVDAVYGQIVEDATFASVNLNGGSLGMTASAANALLARVALIRGQYPAAETAALAAVGGAGYDISAIPYLDAAEQLWSLEFSPTDGNSLGFFYGTSGLGGRYSIAPSADLVAAYEAGDTRMAATVANDGSVNYGVKYSDFGGAANGAGADPVYFFRAAEMVLILAETNARAGNFGPASDWINQIRSRAGLADITLDAGNWEDAILQERFVELALEGGHRLWDLRRFGRAEAVLGAAGYDACDNVWPIPQAEVDRNTAMQQNGCCNC